MRKTQCVVRNRALRIVVAALTASLVGFLAAAALGLLLMMSMLFIQMPQSVWAGILFGGLLLVVFSFAFAASFREMLDKLTSS